MEVAEWNMLQNRFYRKHEIHAMRWQDVDLSRHKVACARFGGPIAMIRDESKMVQLRSESVRPKLLIFSACGKLLSSFVWERPGGRLISIGWTDEEILLCVVQDGTIFQYNVHGELLEQTLSLGEDCWGEGVSECVIWGSGLVCLTEANNLFCIPDLKQPQAVRLADPGLEDPPHCMAVLEPQYTVSGHVEVLLAVGATVLLVDADTVQDQMLNIGPLQRMVVSVGGSFLACFTHDGRLLVVSSDLSKTLVDYNTQSALPPEQLVWCGSDSVVLYWEEQLLMVGPDGEIRYPYDEPIFLIPECDGVRVLSNSATEFLQRVPDSTVSIFGFGSTSPAAMLYDALDHYDKRSAKADENIRLIQSSLHEAVESCIDAAGHEFDPATQKTLMRAASHGLAFCTTFPQNRFREMCKTLRVLNAVRSFDVGIPLSIQQFKVLTAPVLVARLVNARMHLLALRISEFLGLSQETVLVHWACSKIAAATDVPDSVVLHLLVEKLSICAGTSFAAVAAHAHRSGRQKLAALLLDYEPRSSEQVPLLTSMGEEERALVKAIDSGDTDLVYFAIFYLLRQRSAAEFMKTIHAKPLSRALFIIYAKQNDHELLKKFFQATGQPQGVALVLWRESWEQSRTSVVGAEAQLPVTRLRMIEQAHGLYSQLKDHSYEASVTDDYLRLLKVQLELEAATGQAIFVDSSVSDTIKTCIMLGNHRAAQKIRTDFKLSDKRFWWLKVFALAALRDWAALEKFSTEKKSPIGYMPFVEACLEEGENAEALKYVSRVSDAEQRAEAYERLGMAKEAAEAAAQAKDGPLGRLKLPGFGSNTAAGALIDTLRDRLTLQAQ